MAAGRHYSVPLLSLHLGNDRSPLSGERERSSGSSSRDRSHQWPRDSQGGGDGLLHPADERGRIRDVTHMTEREREREHMYNRDRVVRERDSRERERLSYREREWTNEKERERGTDKGRDRSDRERDRSGRERERDRVRDRELEWRLSSQQGRESERDVSKFLHSSRREDGELRARDHRDHMPSFARHHDLESEKGISRSPSNKRKLSPMMSDLEQRQRLSRSGGPQPMSSRFGPSPPSRLQHPRSSSPYSPHKSVSTSLFRDNPVNSVNFPGTSVAKKSSPAAPLALGGGSSFPGIEKTRSGMPYEDADGITSASTQDTDASEAGIGGLHSAIGRNGEKVESAAVHMLESASLSISSSSEDMPGQVVPGSPMVVDNSPSDGDERANTPALVTIAASRWAEDSYTPQHSPSSASRELRKQMQKSVSTDSEDEDQEASTSPEPGELREEKLHKRVARMSEDGKEYEKELNKRELEELDEDEESDDEEMQQPDLDPDLDSLSCVPPEPPHCAIDMLQGCRCVDEFEKLNKINEGTYGIVFRARNKKTGEVVALKQVKLDKKMCDFPLSSLREINILLSLHHPSVVDVKEVVVGSLLEGSVLDKIFMVMEYMEHDLQALMETMKQPFSHSEVKCLMLQLFAGVKYLHENWVLHRDLKTSNLLLNNQGELKICDFGMARQYGDPLKAYTHKVVTLWYRAPELLLGARKYSTAVDMWSLGCIMAELIAKEALFPGKSEIEEIDMIFKMLGTPNEKIWPDFTKLSGAKCNFAKQPFNRLREKFPAVAFSGGPTLTEMGFDLLNRLLIYDPQKRITADEALNHEWFKEEPLPKPKEQMPSFPPCSEHERRARQLRRPPDPLEEQRKLEIRKAEVGSGGLFG